QPQHVPVQRAACPYRAVVEAVYLGEVQPVAVDVHDHDPPACGAEVDRRDRDPAHRRNAAATPESTGISSPVVWDRSPATSTYTALATCSGSTSRFSSVRSA